MAKRHIAPLVSGRVRLRLLEEADLPMTLAWRNQDHIRKWFLSSDVITSGQHRNWFERYRDRDDDFVFVIEETETLCRPVGQAALYRVNWDHGRAEYGRLMIGDAEAAGLGLATLATTRLLVLAFTEWGLREVRLDVLSGNAAALSVYGRCGFEATAEHDGLIDMVRRRDPIVIA